MHDAPPALLLFAHGTSDGAGGAIAEGLAATLRAGGGFAAVATCFGLQAPSPADALARLPAGPVRLVPLLTTEGHITRAVLPRLLAAAGADAGRVTVLPPLGGDPAMTGFAADLADQAIARAGLDPAAAAVLVAGHGSTRSDASARATRRIADALAATGRYGATGTLFIEQEPSAADWRRVTDRADVVVVPFFLSGGHHEDADLPALLARGGGAPDGTPAGGRRLWLTPALGRHAGMAGLVRRAAGA